MGYMTGILNKFFLTIMFCLYSVSKNSKIIQTFMFSEKVRPKMGLIDPSPLTLPQNRSRSLEGHHLNKL